MTGKGTMDATSLPIDPLWPRAGEWIAPACEGAAPPCDLALLGVPAHLSSITPTGADATPAAVRDALLRYSTWSGSHGVDVGTLRASDFGDVEDPDGVGGDDRVAQSVSRASGPRLLVALGGDNSITYATMLALAGGDLAGWGLVTLDAHHDLRDGVSNGSPVRRLTEAGLPGSSVVQIGIADFSNSPAYAARARDLGITVIHRSDVCRGKLTDIVAGALGVAGAGGRPVFVDIDVDVCDRAEVPGCPASAPGGISADELRRLAFLFAHDPRVRGMDITEVDATADAPDGRTVRLASLLVLDAAAGLCLRKAP
jgi:formiminoglutamase